MNSLYIDSFILIERDRISIKNPENIYFKSYGLICTSLSKISNWSSIKQPEFWLAVYPCDTQITDCQSDTPDLNVRVEIRKEEWTLGIRDLHNAGMGYRQLARWWQLLVRVFRTGRNTLLRTKATKVWLKKINVIEWLSLLPQEICGGRWCFKLSSVIQETQMVWLTFCLYYYKIRDCSLEVSKVTNSDEYQIIFL